MLNSAKAAMMGVGVPIIVTRSGKESGGTISSSDKAKASGPEVPPTTAPYQTVFEVAPPTLEQVVHIPATDKSTKASWSVQARDKDIGELTIEEKDSLYSHSCKKRCHNGARVATDISEEDLGTLLYDRGCKNSDHVRDGIVGAALSALLAPVWLSGRAAMSQHRHSNPISRLHKLTLLSAIPLYGGFYTWLKMNPDQVYYNEKKKVMTYRNQPIWWGQPAYTMVQEGSVPKRGSMPMMLVKIPFRGVHAIFKGVADGLEWCTTAIPDEFKVPLVSKNKFPPTYIAGHGLDKELVDRLYQTSGHSEVTEPGSDTEV